jgi:hypothetical protein
MANHSIQISVVNGSLYFDDGGGAGSGNSVHSHRGDTFKWCCDDGNAACLFVDSPLDIPVILVRKGRCSNAVHVVKPHVPGGNNAYKYSVAVVTPAGQLVTADPEVIVDADPVEPPEPKAATQSRKASKAAKKSAAKRKTKKK